MALTEATIQNEVRRRLAHHEDGGYGTTILWRAFDSDGTPRNRYQQASQLQGGKQYKAPLGLVGRAIEDPTTDVLTGVGNLAQVSCAFLFSRSEFVLKGLIPDPAQNLTLMSTDDRLEVPDIGRKFRVLSVHMTGRIAEFQHEVVVLAKDDNV